MLASGGAKHVCLRDDFGYGNICFAKGRKSAFVRMKRVKHWLAMDAMGIEEEVIFVLSQDRSSLDVAERFMRKQEAVPFPGLPVLIRYILSVLFRTDCVSLGKFAIREYTGRKVPWWVVTPSGLIEHLKEAGYAACTESV
ncbi:MAG: hypothetical protein EBX52_13375 [Proteobacteria bacterium]|nr:hypothetical protein [Pseudomonadota bacterium]